MEKFCPFKKQVVFMDNDGKEDFAVKQKDAFFAKEYFLECIGDNCMMWNTPFHTCSLRNSIG